jgi:hypothetical protein
MQQEFNVSATSIPQAPPCHDIPIVTLDGLLDLLTVLEDQLVACPGIIPLLSNALKEELAEVIDDGGS